MRNAIIFLSIVFTVGCNSEQDTSGSRNAELNLDWLIGERERTDGDSTVQMIESWKKNGKDFEGFAFGIRGVDTVFKEYLLLSKDSNKWTYKVTGVHEYPVDFELSSLTDSSFICENPENEFPKKIHYTNKIDHIHAFITGGSDTINFHFK